MRFKIALSFPREYREFVEKVATILADKVGKNAVLYDNFYEAEFARPNLDTYLQRLYHDESELICVFLCADYAKKEWCGLEWRAIRDLIKKRRESDIMPIRFDNTQIPGLFSTDGYIWAGNRSPEAIAQLIIQRSQKEPTGKNKSTHIPANHLMPECPCLRIEGDYHQIIPEINSFIQDAIVRGNFDAKPEFELVSSEYITLESELTALLKDKKADGAVKQEISTLRFEIQKRQQATNRAETGVRAILFSKNLKGWFPDLNKHALVLVSYLNLLIERPVSGWPDLPFDFFPPGEEVNARLNLNASVVDSLFRKIGIENQGRPLHFLTKQAGLDIYDLPETVIFEQAIPRAVYAFSHSKTVPQTSAI